MWTPSEVRKLITLIFGFVLMGCGVYLIIAQVQAEGTINISLSTASGEIESGSAGMLLCFFAFFLIVASIIGRSRTRRAEMTSGAEISLGKAFSESTWGMNRYMKRYLVGIGVVFILVLALFLLNYAFPQEGAGWLLPAFFGGVILSIMILNFIIVYVNEDSSEEIRDEHEPETGSE